MPEIQALAERTTKPITLGLAGFPGATVTIPAGWWLVVERDWSETYWSPRRWAEYLAAREKGTT